MGEKVETPEHDFRFFQYSKFALPALLFILGIFIALILLTMWESASDIRQLKAGTPRTLTQTSIVVNGVETGIKVYKRNVRIAVFFMGLVFTTAAFGVFFADLSPVWRARVNYLIGICMILVGVLSWIAFALDVNSERHAVHCLYAPNQSTTCLHREDLATGATVFDAASALFLDISGLLLLAYTYSGDFCREKSQAEEFEVYGIHRANQPGLVRNGVSSVRKTITLLSLVATFISLIILAIFTIMLAANADTYIAKDSNNRPAASGSALIAGWPLKCTKLRYAVCSFAIVTILFNLIPITSRVIAYLLAFSYVLYAVLAFTSFGIDIDAIEQAKLLQCPTGYSCTYAFFNIVVVLDFMGGISLLLYVIYEFIWRRSRQPVDVSQAPPVIVA